MSALKKSSIAAGTLGFIFCCSLFSGPLPTHGEGTQSLAADVREDSPKPSHDGHFKRHPRGHFFGGHAVKTTAELIGMDKEDLITQLRAGRTLLQIVQEKKGWSESEYIAKLTDAASKKIDTAVQNGKLDAEHASRIKASLPLRLKEAIHRNWANHSEKPDAKTGVPNGIFRQHEALFIK
ncbi:hypothetical protein [Paenibacillus caui]|uniref:hypothetical protein n=1 Tax=Paenibacillus caui TaxID=2873927 RepID=UPI001CA7F102|nr:hypothetical protein [Paenibacillus caui]